MSSRNPAESMLNEATAYLEQLHDECDPDSFRKTLARFPECAEQLTAYLAQRKQVDRLFDPLRTAINDSQPPEIDGYADLTVIASGGMGVVYRALQLASQREVAIKVIKDAQWLDSKQTRESLFYRFQLEALAMRDHENIVRLYHAGEVDKTPYIVMEYVEGGSLREWIHDKKLSLAQTVKLLHETASALSFAHQHGVLHRDVKPSNILVDSTHCTAKLADFGLAHIRPPSATNTASQTPYFHPPDDTEFNNKAACETTVVGTEPYFAPELFQRGVQHTIASDIYALGATLYEALHGMPPTVGQLKEHDQQHLPRALARIYKRCLATDPTARYASAEEVATDLAAFQAPREQAIAFVNMGRMLLIFAGLLALSGLAVQWLLSQATLTSWIWIAALSPYLFLFAMFHHTRLPAHLQSHDAKRQLWSVWLGSCGAVLVLSLAVQQQIPDLVSSLPLFYQMLAAICGASLIAMGANIWRGHYYLGGGWFVVVLLMLLTPTWSPLIFGLCGAICATVISSNTQFLMREYTGIDKKRREK